VYKEGRSEVGADGVPAPDNKKHKNDAQDALATRLTNVPIAYVLAIPKLYILVDNTRTVTCNGVACEPFSARVQ